MKVTIRFFGQIRQAAGRAAEILELESPITPKDLVERLAQESGDPLRSHLLGADGKLRPSLVLVVGDEQIDVGAAAPLRDGDELTILPPIAGG